MRVLILSQHFAPEVTAARIRIEEFARGLLKRGHELEVICEVPNHPAGIVAPGYRRRPLVRRRLNGIAVRYVWVRTRPNKNLGDRLLLYGSYAAMATVAGAFSRRPDVILASSPPLPVGAAAMALAARHRVPWVMDVRDLWPEVAVALGELADPAMIRAAERLERRLYRSAAAIVTVTDAFREQIAAATDPGKVRLIPNGTTRAWLRLGETDVPRSELAVPRGEFVWTYAGNVGLAQGLDTAVEAAVQLGDGYRLLIVGAGPELERLRAEAAALQTATVEFRPAVEPAEAGRLMRGSDALLVPLDRRPSLEKFVPSKLYDCSATGRPVIVAAAGEVARLAEDADAALVVPPGDPAALAAAVRTLREDAGAAERIGESGRRFAAGHLREEQTGELEQVLASVAR